MAPKIYVSGYGIVSALGLGVIENFNALRSIQSGVSRRIYLNTVHQEILVGEVKASNEKLCGIAGLKNDSFLSRTALLGLIAASEAMDMAGIDPVQITNPGLINGTTVGGMDVSELAYREMKDGKKIDFRRSFQGHDCGHTTEKIAEELGINGYLQTISTACSSSANSIMNAGRMIKAGLADCIIAGGTDALSLFTLNGFNALKILDHQHCKPFDAERKGLNLGEGAAYLVLESEKSIEKRKATALAELVGYGNANDAYHQTASSPEGRGAFLAMKKALDRAGLPSKTIDYINAHGTGTVNNDLSESRAIQNIFVEHIPPYSSTKAFTGHTLAAAGAIEAVFSLLCLRHQAILPNLNFSAPMMSRFPPPVTSFTSITVNYVLSNSFGFGGNCSSLILANVS